MLKSPFNPLFFNKNMWTSRKFNRLRSDHIGEWRADAAGRLPMSRYRTTRRIATTAACCWCAALAPALAIDVDEHPRLLEIVNDLADNEGLDRAELTRLL